jgi:aerobic carbon-monoxide dehydrogenase medium subunit
MKAPPLTLLAPRTATEAVELLADLGDSAKPLAGGQSLMPMTIMRLARPAYLIDLNRVTDFTGLERGGDGGYRFGPLVRHYDVERLAGEKGIGGYLGSVAPAIAHLPIRLRGTVAGSLAHADPASEWCAALLAADATVTARGTGTERVLEIGELLQGSFTTALRPDELLVEVTVPGLLPGWGAGFDEVSRRPGDFALALCAAMLCVSDGEIRQARVALGGAGGGVARCGPAEEALIGSGVSATTWTRAGDVAADVTDFFDDIHTSATHRQQLVRIVVRRALAAAARHAHATSDAPA